MYKYWEVDFDLVDQAGYLQYLYLPKFCLAIIGNMLNILYF